MEHFTAGEFGFPCIAAGGDEAERCLLVADVADHAADEAVVFAKAHEGLEDALVDEAEVGAARCNVHG